MEPTAGTGQEQDASAQILIWRRQSNSIPGLLGGKTIWVPLVFELVALIGDSTVSELDSVPDLSPGLFSRPSPLTGAKPRQEPGTWRQYLAFLRGIGLVENSDIGFSLSTVGREILEDPTPRRLGTVFADKVRLFAESLAAIASQPMTVEAVHDQIQAAYKPTWKELSGTRSRLDWQEKIGLISPIANRQWEITSLGSELLEGRTLVSPEALELKADTVVDIKPAPPEIETLLGELRDSVREHTSRSTYNIWVPSPPTRPNKVENLRVIVNAALTRISRAELFDFICNAFDLKRSSVESMLPFMRASGIIVEVGRGIYEATPAARAWIESQDDVNFIRILHAHMRFVGEMIREAKFGVERSKIYAAGKTYGLNVDKCRWIASMLLNTGLIEESKYGSLRATAFGVALSHELPLAPSPKPQDSFVEHSAPTAVKATIVAEESFGQRLTRLAKDPSPNGTRSGSAFEYAVRDVFLAMGFKARVISGSGDTDVLVQWHSDDGALETAVVEAKARSKGHVAHTDISDVALETHKGRNGASFVAVIGPTFSGDTIRNMAEQRGWSLIEAARLGVIAESVVALGIRPREAALLFKLDRGLADLEDLIAERARELDVISFIFAKLNEEAEETGEPISARDISREARKGELAPSMTEVVSGIETIAHLQCGALTKIDPSDRPEYETYSLGDVLASVRRLRALANSIERGTSISV